MATVPQTLEIETTRMLESNIQNVEGDFLPRRAKNEKPNVSIEIGERLATLRKQRGFTQVELAEKLGISQGVVSEYERGDSRLTAPILLRIVELLGVSADEILGVKPTSTKTKPKGWMSHRLRRVEDLPPADRKMVLRFVDGLIARQAGGR